MCGLCKLNAAALDTTVACGYNGIDQHNLGLLPPSRGLIRKSYMIDAAHALLPPIAGIDILKQGCIHGYASIAPHRGD